MLTFAALCAIIIYILRVHNYFVVFLNLEVIGFIQLKFHVVLKLSMVSCNNQAC